MPLVSIHSVPPTDRAAIAPMLADVRDAGARALRCSPDNIWVMFHEVPPEHYLQVDHTPVVIARAQVGRSNADRDAFVAAIADAVGRGLEMPTSDVWIHYQEMRSEDVWFGGRWAR